MINHKSHWVLIILPFFIFYGTVHAQIKKNEVRIIIKLNAHVDSFSVKIAQLKYDKSFAFSFTLDDGLVCDYLVAFPFFNGGKMSGPYIDQWGNDQGGDGLHYPGLCYTDGCGNIVPFKAGIALNAKSIEGANAVTHHGFLTWEQVETLYKSGWDVLNHSYSHATGKNVNILYEIKKNNKEVKRHLGFEMKDFVIPGGHDDMLSNGPYTITAFKSGMETVQCENFGNYLINIDTIQTLRHLKVGRLFMHTIGDSILQFRSGSNLSIEGAQKRLFNIIGMHLKRGKPFWINAFTHGVSNQNIWNISIIFPEFISFFNRLAERYGQQGADNMWMAPAQEVYEYLLNRDSIKYKVEKRGKTVIIFINKKTIPKGLKYHEMTFLFNSYRDIESVSGVHCRIESYSKNKSQNIININLP